MECSREAVRGTLETCPVLVSSPVPVSSVSFWSAANELTHLAAPLLDVFGRLLEFLMLSVAVGINDVAVIGLIGPVDSDEQSR